MILVLPTLDQMTDILDLKPLERFSLFWFWMILLLFALIGIVALILIYLKYRKKEEDVVEEIIIPERIITPREKALEALDSLEKLGLIERGQYRKYYFRFSEILKVFLEEELKITSVDATTEEIVFHLDSFSLAEEEKKFISTILKGMDLVKFAKAIPTNAQTQSLRQNVQRFLNTFN